MKIGKLLEERMKILGISIDDLSNSTYIDVEILQGLYNNELDFNDIDEYDKKILCNALFCSEEYFINAKARKFDIVTSSVNRGKEQDEIAIKTKCKLQRFIKDFVFVNELRKESNNGQ